MKADHDLIRQEVDEIRRIYPTLSQDGAFVAWFLRAFIVDDGQLAVDSLTGGSGDKNLDAVLVDDENQRVFLIQAKYRDKRNGHHEKPNDVLGFAAVSRSFWGAPEARRKFLSGMEPASVARLNQAFDRLHRRRYVLAMYYVTLGRCSRPLRDDAESAIAHADGRSEFTLLDGKDILRLLTDYLDGAAPPIPRLDLPIEQGGAMETTGIIHRFDKPTGLESWVFCANGQDVGRLFRAAGIRLFARNIRGFLGNTQINRGMADTLASQPENFWYFNNGVTIVCDNAQKTSQDGQDILRLFNPQLINGQQTTRTLEKHGRPKASVLVRTIKIPRDGEWGRNHFDGLVTKVVCATNWQNAIRQSDLRANDARQVRLEREFRKHGYHYLRKRETKGEAKMRFGGTFKARLKKEELAQAVAACELDPLLVREGKEGLFHDRYYATIFGNNSVYFYLTRYWLMKAIQGAAHGYPERAYAKWLVLNFVWNELKEELGKRRVAEDFCRAFEARWHSRQLRIKLHRLIGRVFRAATMFYRRERGSGERAKDVSTFFKRAKLHVRFAEFWHSRANDQRCGFDRIKERFLTQLALFASE